ncbi:MAG: NAD(P)H-dependent glycerol-3-phosphate dehydrogenase [Alphaproteobacteria bacterium]
MAKSFNHFGIIGGGAWGTALAVALLSAGRSVTLWAHEKEVVSEINQRHENTTFLPGIKLGKSLKATQDLKDLADCDAWVLVTPAQHTRSICEKVNSCAPHSAVPIIIASKGIEDKSTALLSDIVTSVLPQHAIAVLSGPSFAIEVARGQPAALTLAMKDQTVGETLCKVMASPSFRLYLSDDVIGAQIGGAIKNVLAVACGVIAGRNMGENARAALITRGLAELVRLGTALGGRAETLMGLSGLGDLVLTCSSSQSRNMSLGMALGQGKTLADILASRSTISEGVYTASAALALAKKLKIEMPIVEAVDAVLNRKADIDTAIAGLMARPLKAETR